MGILVSMCTKHFSASVSVHIETYPSDTVAIFGALHDHFAYFPSSNSSEILDACKLIRVIIKGINYINF
jgi:hypothetical protein